MSSRKRGGAAPAEQIEREENHRGADSRDEKSAGQPAAVSKPDKAQSPWRLAFVMWGIPLVFITVMAVVQKCG